MSYLNTQENFLSDSLLQKLGEFTYSEPPLRSNITSWEGFLIGASSAILIQDIEGELKNDLVSEIKNKLDIDFSGCTFECTYVLGTRGSFLQWHNDGNHFYSITVFMNDNWDRNYGGAFMYEIDDVVTAVYPKRNKAVLMKPPVEHGTSATSQDAPLRQTVQVFINKKTPSN